VYELMLRIEVGVARGGLRGAFVPRCARSLHRLIY
jgi:hypothetical protein